MGLRLRRHKSGFHNMRLTNWACFTFISLFHSYKVYYVIIFILVNHDVFLQKNISAETHIYNSVSIDYRISLFHDPFVFIG